MLYIERVARCAQWIYQLHWKQVLRGSLFTFAIYIQLDRYLSLSPIYSAYLHFVQLQHSNIAPCFGLDRNSCANQLANGRKAVHSVGVTHSTLGSVAKFCPLLLTLNIWFAILRGRANGSLSNS